MKLNQIIGRLDELADDECIFARKPWSPDSESVVAPLAKNFRVPTSISILKMDYFLEVHVAKEVLEAFADRRLSIDNQLKLLIFYGENDAFPEWVYG